MTWNFEYVRVDLSRIEGYLILYRRRGEQEFRKIEVSDPGATSYVIKGLQLPLKYQVFMKAYNDGYESPPSNTVDADATTKGGYSC